MEFFLSDTDDERVEALIDLLLEALAEAPFEYSTSDCAAALARTLHIVFLDAEGETMH